MRGFHSSRAIVLTVIVLGLRTQLRAEPPTEGFGPGFSVLAFGEPGGVPRRISWSFQKSGLVTLTASSDHRTGRASAEKKWVAVFAGVPYSIDGVTERFGPLVNVRHYTIPAVKKGDLVPIFGVMYRAEKDSDSEFDFTRVEVKEFPSGIEPARVDSLYLPIDTGREEGIETREGSGVPWLAAESITVDKKGRSPS